MDHEMFVWFNLLWVILKWKQLVRPLQQDAEKTGQYYHSAFTSWLMYLMQDIQLMDTFTHYIVYILCDIKNSQSQNFEEKRSKSGD